MWRTSRPVSRILWPRRTGTGDHPSGTAVADGLLRPTRELGRAALERSLSDLAPGGVYLATLVTEGAGGLLHRPFTLTAAPERRGGLLSVALSRGSPRVGVTHHPALWSPDFPQWVRGPTAVARPARPPGPWYAPVAGLPGPQRGCRLRDGGQTGWTNRSRRSATEASASRTSTRSPSGSAGPSTRARTAGSSR
jgi:hypothetical protein